VNPKILWCSGLALPVLLVSVALTACGYKTTDYSRPSTAVALLRFNANGTPGTLDTSFGTQGVVTKDVDTFQDDVAFATVLQPDGKIIVVGTSFTTPARVVVIRYDATGAPDLTFGTNGITVTSLPSADASAFAATLQTDGKLLVAGRSCPLSGGSSFLLLRYNTAGAPGTVGTLDASFAGTGIVTTAIPSGSSTSANAVAVSGTDILVAGHSKIGGRFVIALARYDSSGAPVSTFGNSGIVTTPVGSLDADAVALAVQPDGKIVAAGLAGNAVSQIWDVALLRYNANGSLDTDPNPTMGFGGGTGIVTTDIGSSSNYANAVAIQGDGKIVVVGNAFVNSFAATSDIAVLRYNSNGSLDTDPITGFGGGTGIVTTNVSAFDNGFAVAVQSDNKIVVAGNADAGTGDRLALLRYNADGSLDADPMTGFGTGGIVTRAASGPSTIAGAFAVLLQPGGEIVVAGYD